MPDNKNHHYVPRFYLRHFTPNEKCIDLFNLQTQKLILKAPIKGQCCRDYFYGKNKDHEKSLGQAVVRVFAESQKTERSSEIVQTSRQDIRTGASLQFLRTHKHAARWLEAFKKAKYQKAATVRDEQLLERFEAHDLAVETGNAKFEEMVFAVYGRHVKDGTF